MRARGVTRVWRGARAQLKQLFALFDSNVQKSLTIPGFDAGILQARRCRLRSGARQDARCFACLPQGVCACLPALSRACTAPVCPGRAAGSEPHDRLFESGMVMLVEAGRPPLIHPCISLSSHPI